ncbi:MAG: hypothetical protein GY714_19665 [Desulfobacterales bacterium]|nr:hypothetical protein [Desulfobacterales bacterium]
MDVSSLLIKLTTTLTPSYDKIEKDIKVYEQKNFGVGRDELARSYADRICWKFASLGAITTLPGVLPGIGTAAMIATEGCTLSGNLAMMIRWMGSMVAGISLMYKRDVYKKFNKDFIQVLGLWSGILVIGEESIGQTGDKVVINQEQAVPPKIFNRINQKVGSSMIKRRGGVAIGTLAPFGVGAIVGGSFNLVTMKSFKQNALKYYSFDGREIYYIKE